MPLSWVPGIGERGNTMHFTKLIAVGLDSRGRALWCLGEETY